MNKSSHEYQQRKFYMESTTNISTLGKTFRRPLGGKRNTNFKYEEKGFDILLNEIEI